MDNNILDLDAVAPAPRLIKVRGKTLQCNPLTIRQIVQIANLETKLKNAKTADEILPAILEVLSGFIPAIKDDSTIDFTIEEMWHIIRFAQNFSLPTQATDAKQYDTKKKVTSLGE